LTVDTYSIPQEVQEFFSNFSIKCYQTLREIIGQPNVGKTPTFTFSSRGSSSS